MSEARPRKVVRLLVQALLFAAGLALFGWVAWTARAELTEERIAELKRAGPAFVAALVGLSLASFCLNGFGWWVAVSPVRRLSVWRTLAVNVVATGLSYLPGKLSVLFRVLYHKRVDRMPVMQFGGWAAAFGGVTVVGLGPGVAATLLLPDAAWGLWLGATAVGVVVAFVALVVGSRWVASDSGWRLLESIARRLPKGEAVLASGPFVNLHTGVAMVANERATGLGVVIRQLDALGYAARFLVMASVLNVEMTLAEAAVAGVSFFLISALAPTGPLGLREAATGGVLGALVSDGLKIVVVSVSAVELATVAVAGLIAGVALSRGRRGVDDAAGVGDDGDGGRGVVGSTGVAGVLGEVLTEADPAGRVGEAVVEGDGPRDDDEAVVRPGDQAVEE
ncbi:MAG: lysylphosphatidylglycerol synthase domain-containing protein [Planctomycetota bacterium]